MLPLAMITVRLTNTASLLLPVSNLTNLLAVARLTQVNPQNYTVLEKVGSGIEATYASKVLELIAANTGSGKTVHVDLGCG